MEIFTEVQLDSYRWVGQYVVVVTGFIISQRIYSLLYQRMIVSHKVVNSHTACIFPLPPSLLFSSLPFSFCVLSSSLSPTAYMYNSKTIEACCVHLFDIVTQYKGIFPDGYSMLISIHGNAGKQVDGTLFCGWLK